MSDFIKTDIGRFPASWSVKPLGTLFATQLGKMLSQKAHGGNAPKQYLRNKNVQWAHIDTSDMLEMDFSPREMEKYRLRVGDLLVCEGGEPGRAAIWQGQVEECYYQKALHRLRPIDGQMYSEFLAHWLRFSIQLENLYGVAGASSTIAHLPEVQLVSLPIPVPPLHEQRKIAAVIGRVQWAIEQQERLLALTTELKNALLNKLFTEGLRGEPQKQTEIGPVPESWETVKISSLGKIVTGSTPKTKIPEYYSPAECDFVAPADLGQTRQVYSSEKKISRKGLETIRPLPKDAVMCVCIGSSIGKVGMTFKGISATNQQINSIVCNDRHDPAFIYYLLSHFAEYWRGFATFGPVPILSKGVFETINIAVPETKDEELEIALCFIALDAKMEVHIHRKTLLADLFRTLLHQLMTAQIRVHDLELPETE